MALATLEAELDRLSLTVEDLTELCPVRVDDVNCADAMAAVDIYLARTMNPQVYDEFIDSLLTLEAVAPEKAIKAWSTVEPGFETLEAGLTATTSKNKQAERATANAKTTKQRATANAKATRQRSTADARATVQARATPTPTPYYVSVDDTVNLRSGPGTNHTRVGVARPGDSFAVIGYQAGSPYNWLEIRYGSGTAWIAESLTRLQR